MLSRERVVVGELLFLLSLTAEGGMGVACAMQLAAVDGVIVNGGGGIMEAFVLLRIVLDISCDNAGAMGSPPSLSIFYTITLNLFPLPALFLSKYQCKTALPYYHCKTALP